VAQVALSAFAASGFRKTTMAAFARRAGVSTGNVYRYYQNKGALFDAVVPRRIATEFLELSRERMTALRTLAGPQTEALHLALSEEQLAFCIRHRLEMIVLLGRSEDTPFTGFCQRLTDMLVTLATEHLEACRAGKTLSDDEACALELIYENLVSAMLGILERYSQEDAIRQAASAYTRYHFTGLGSFL
jgi:AcrR family transcriptional regulator